MKKVLFLCIVAVSLSLLGCQQAPIVSFQIGYDYYGVGIEMTSPVYVSWNSDTPVEDRNLVFASSDTSIISVAADGTITGVAVGTAVITAAYRDDPENIDTFEVECKPSLFITNDVGADLEMVYWGNENFSTMVSDGDDVFEDGKTVAKCLDPGTHHIEFYLWGGLSPYTSTTDITLDDERVNYILKSGTYEFAN